MFDDKPIIAVGSINAVKVKAVEEALQHYPHLAMAQIRPIGVPSGIAAQPMSLKETIQGAKNRAKGAYEGCEGCTYGFGIESGLCEAPGSKTGFLNMCVCCIFNGSEYHMGFSPGFEVPSSILALILDHQMDLSEACFHSGITENEKIGSAEGLIGILTKGRVDRKEYTKHSVVTALVQLENSDWYPEN